MLIALAPSTSEDPARFREISDDGSPSGPVARCEGLPSRAREIPARNPGVRWLWPSTADVYPSLYAAGVDVGRCHDLELVEALLVGAEGSWGAPRSLLSAWARLNGQPVPPDPPARTAEPPGTTQEAL